MSYERNLSRDTITAKIMLEKAEAGEIELQKLASEEKELKMKLDLRVEGRVAMKSHTKKVF